LSADHRVEEIAEFEPAVALEDEEIVLGGVEDLAYVRRGEDRCEWREFLGSAECERIDQVDLPARGDLDKTRLVEIVIETVASSFSPNSSCARLSRSSRVSMSWKSATCGLFAGVIKFSFPEDDARNRVSAWRAHDAGRDLSGAVDRC
jgi:hypothetical protein